MVWRNGTTFHNEFLHLPYFSKLVSHTSSFLLIGNSPLRCRVTVRNCIQIRPLLHWCPRSRFSGISDVTSRNQLLGHSKNSLSTKRRAIMLRTPDVRCRTGQKCAGSSVLACGLVASGCEYSSRTKGSTKCGEILDYLADLAESLFWQHNCSRCKCTFCSWVYADG